MSAVIAPKRRGKTVSSLQKIRCTHCGYVTDVMLATRAKRFSLCCRNCGHRGRGYRK
jgi:hypothetical protein